MQRCCSSYDLKSSQQLWGLVSVGAKILLGEMGKRAGKTLHIKLCSFLIPLICESSQLSSSLPESLMGGPSAPSCWSLPTAHGVSPPAHQLGVRGEEETGSFA